MALRSVIAYTVLRSPQYAQIGVRSKATPTRTKGNPSAAKNTFERPGPGFSWNARIVQNKANAVQAIPKANRTVLPTVKNAGRG